MHEIHIRSARAEDAAAIAELAPSAEDMRQAAPREMSPLDEEMVRQWLREEGAAGFVLERDGQILAYGELNENPHQARTYWIGHVMVRPSHRGAGLGRALVGALLKHAVGHRRAREVRISAFKDNPAALRSYRACGFIEHDRRWIDGRILVDLRYRHDRPERIVPRPAAGLLAAGAAGLGTLLLPDAFLAPLHQLGAGHLGFTLIVGAAAAGLFGLLLHPLLPRRTGTRLERLLLPVIYGSAVALAATAATGTVLFVLARLGLGVGSPLLSTAMPEAAAMRGRQGLSLLIEAVSRALALGVLGGALLALVSGFVERRRG